MLKCQVGCHLLVLVAAAGVVTGTAPLGAAFAQPAEPGENLVTNSSFEEADPGSPVPAGWQAPPQVLTRDAGVAKTGKASLKYVNHDSKQYVLCTQKVSVRPGWKCRFGVWIRTEWHCSGPCACRKGIGLLEL